MDELTSLRLRVAELEEKIRCLEKNAREMEELIRDLDHQVDYSKVAMEVSGNALKRGPVERLAPTPLYGEPANKAIMPPRTFGEGYKLAYKDWMVLPEEESPMLAAIVLAQKWASPQEVLRMKGKRDHVPTQLLSAISECIFSVRAEYPFKTQKWPEEWATEGRLKKAILRAARSGRL